MNNDTIRMDPDLSRRLAQVQQTLAKLATVANRDDRIHRSIGSLSFLLDCLACSEQFTSTQQEQFTALEKTWHELLYGEGAGHE